MSESRPPRWTIARLDRLCVSLTDGDHQPPPKATSGVPFITISAMNDGVVRLNKVTRFVPQSYYDSLTNDRKPRTGDILFSVTGSVGIAAPIATDVPFVFQRHIAIIRPDTQLVESGYLLHFLRHPLARDELLAGATGTAQLTIPLRALRALAVLLPPLPEQRRIAAKLDGLFTRTKAAREELAHIPLLIEHYKQAILEKAFTGELVSFGEAIESTFYGPRFAREEYTKDGVVTLRTTDFDEAGNIVPKSPPSIHLPPKEFARFGLVDGDILVTRTGSIGKCAIYTDNIGPAIPSAYLIRVRLNKLKIFPRYALLFLLSPSGQRQLGLGITAVTQPNINAGVIERLELPLPSLSTQKEIVKDVEAAMEWLTFVGTEQRKAARLLAHLDQRLLAKAFEGGLVPQDPSDEPAEMLLERIRASRGAQPKSRRRATARPARK